MTVRYAMSHNKSLRSRRDGLGPRGAGGFSLVEMLIVLTILGMLLGITALGSSNVFRSARVRQTTDRMDKLMAAESTYFTRLGVHIAHCLTEEVTYAPLPIKCIREPQMASGTLRQTLDKLGEENDVETRHIERFVWMAAQFPPALELMSDMGGDAMDDYDADGLKEVVDGWGNPLEYAAFVQYSRDLRDERDGPDDVEDYTGDDFLPRHEEPFFAARGNNGKWGSADPSTATPQDRQEEQDNLYSFD